MKCAERSLVDRHFAGATTPTAEHRMRQHLIGCKECQGLYRRHLLLARLDPAAPSAEDRLGAGLGVRPRPRVAKPLFVASMSLALASLLFFVVRPSGDGFSSRGAADRVQLFAYRTSGGAPARVGSQVSRTDELSFAYVNLAAKKHLLIYAVDEHGAVYWYHPEWKRADEDPRAVAAESGTAVHELPEAVRHSFSGKKLVVWGVFTDEPLSVRQVETRLQKGAAFSDALVVKLPLEVVP